jgi:hypothetical protein
LEWRDFGDRSGSYSFRSTDGTPDVIQYGEESHSTDPSCQSDTPTTQHFHCRPFELLRLCEAFYRSHSLEPGQRVASPPN